jgi:histidinol-phosphate aminotransferase
MASTVSSLGLFHPTLARTNKSGLQNTSHTAETGIAKLNGNENPYGPSPNALKAMAVASTRGGYYVNTSAQTLRKMIAERHGLTPDHVLLSSGSTVVLACLAMMATRKGNILVPDLFWDTTAKLAVRNSKYRLERIAMTKKLEIDLKRMMEAINKDISLVQLTNPNNPTGIPIDTKELKKFCTIASEHCPVLIDEAYNELAKNPEQSSMISLVREGRNVAVARTFSKIHGLAGMRIGYMVAQPGFLKKISGFGVAGDWSTNQAGIAAAIASYDDEDFLKYSKAKIVEGKEMIAEAAKKNGLEILPSQANFIFINLGSRNADEYKTAMRDQNILISGKYRNYSNWSRVSMGKIEDLERYIGAMPLALDRIS